MKKKKKKKKNWFREITEKRIFLRTNVDYKFAYWSFFLNKYVTDFYIIELAVCKTLQAKLISYVLRCYLSLPLYLFLGIILSKFCNETKIVYTKKKNFEPTTEKDLTRFQSHFLGFCLNYQQYHPIPDNVLYYMRHKTILINLFV